MLDTKTPINCNNKEWLKKLPPNDKIVYLILTSLTNVIEWL